MRYGRASEPTDATGRYYHVRCTREDMASYVLLPGDPDRVARISQHWDEAQETARYRHYVVHTGRLSGIPITAVSTGTGNPSMAMVVEEVARLGASTLIRVGTCGAIQPGIAIGDVIITTGSMRMDGATRVYVPPEYPAVASYEVVLALVQAASTLGIPHHVGITASTDSWYVGQGRPGFGGFLPDAAAALIPTLRAARVLNFEMDSSALLTLSNVFGLRAGAVCAVYANRAEDVFAMEGEDRAIAVAHEAVRILKKMDDERTRRHLAYWFPDQS